MATTRPSTILRQAARTPLSCEASAETHSFDPELVRYLTGLGYAADVTATIVNTPSVLVHWRDGFELNANGIAAEDASTQADRNGSR